MSFAGPDFLQVAQKLIQGTATEGALRSAISRSYYSAFLHAREYCWLNGLRIDKSGRAHDQVRLSLSSRGQQHLAANLRDLHALRKNADYDIPFPRPNLQAEAGKAVHLARKIIRDIDALP